MYFKLSVNYIYNHRIKKKHTHIKLERVLLYTEDWPGQSPELNTGDHAFHLLKRKKPSKQITKLPGKAS